MIWLAMATSGDPCSIAVCDDKGLVAERTFRHRMRLSERLMGDTESVLMDAGIELAEVDAFAVDLGPGSFTGVRIGVTAIKTWADLFAKPVVGVSALETAAMPLTGAHAEIVVPMIRARPGAVYTSAYDGRTGAEIAPPHLLTADGMSAMAEGWGGKRVTVTGDGWPPFADLLETAAGEHGIAMALVSSEAPAASSIVEIARARFAKGQTDSAIDLIPLYIAPPPIGGKAK